MKPKIYLFCVPDGYFTPDCVGYALAEDGKGLASHLSSNLVFSKHDLGLTSTCKHDRYAKHYPDGYEIEWINTSDLPTHKGYRDALRRYRERETV